MSLDQASLRTLARWGNVALAVRAAQRAAPLLYLPLHEGVPGWPEAKIAALNCLKFAKAVAYSGDESLSPPYELVQLLKEVSVRLDSFQGLTRVATKGLRNLAIGAGRALRSAAYAATAAYVVANENAEQATWDGISNSSQAVVFTVQAWRSEQTERGPQPGVDLQTVRPEIVGNAAIEAAEADFHDLIRQRGTGSAYLDTFFTNPLWPVGVPDEWLQAVEYFEESLEPDAADTWPLIVVWDPTLISPEDYAALVQAIGDDARLAGGLGVHRVRSEGLGIACAKEVFA